MSLSLLLATPQLTGSFFEHAALLMLEQEQSGALGLMFSRSVGRTIADILPQAAAHHRAEEVYLGGPVETSGGWCLYRTPTNQPNELQLGEHLWLSRDSAVLELLLHGDQPFKLLLGYAGWGAAQLEHEVQVGSWLWGEVSGEQFDTLLWHTPTPQRWHKALQLLGTEAGQLGGSAKA